MRIAIYNPISNKALDSVNLPSRLKILDFGDTDSTKGPVIVNDKSLRAFNSTQKKMGRTRIPIDFDHSTVEGTKAYEESKGQPKRIAGYGTPILSNEGLFLEDIKWTPDGQEFAKNYEDLSPAPLLDDDNVLLGIHSCALTPAGAIENLHFYSADNIFKDMKILSNTPVKDKEPLVKEEPVKAYEAETETEDDGDGDEDKISQIKGRINTAAEKHGIAVAGGKGETKAMSADMPDAYKNTMPTAVTEQNNYMEKLEAQTEKVAKTTIGAQPQAEALARLKEAFLAFFNGVSGEEAPITNKENSKLQSFSADLATLQTKVVALEAKTQQEVARLEQEQKDALVVKASNDGKVIPLSAESIKSTSLELLREMVSKLPKDKVPMKATLRALNSDGKSVKPTKADSIRILNELTSKS